MIMDCNEYEGMLVDYVDGLLSPAIRANVDRHLAGCKECSNKLEEYRTLFSSIQAAPPEQPGAALRAKFDIMLQHEIAIENTTRPLDEMAPGRLVTMTKTSMAFRVAACAVLLAAGIFIGSRFSSASLPEKHSTELADLKTEVKAMKETLLFSMLNDESASERIKAVNYAEEMGGNNDQKISNALFNTLNTDKNLNVRLAALYSVARFAALASVRDSLLVSLPKQTEPIIQIVLINILTERKETRAIEPIRRILLDKHTMKPVKEIAQKGLRIL